MCRTAKRSWSSASPVADAIASWLVIRSGEASVCLKHPGFEPSLVIFADASSLFRAWLNRVSLDGELNARRIRADGPRALVWNWPKWFEWPSLPTPVARQARRNRPVGTESQSRALAAQRDPMPESSYEAEPAFSSRAAGQLRGRRFQ